MKYTGARGAYKLLTGSEPEIEKKETGKDNLLWIILSSLFILLAIVLQGCNAYALDIPEEQAIKAIIGEAENQGYDGMLAVACAIRNRGTLKGVYGLKSPRVVKGLYTKGTWLQAKTAWVTSKELIETPNCLYFKGRPICPSGDVVYGANSWENINAFGKPYWVDTCQPTVLIKDHQFYICPTPKKGN